MSSNSSAKRLERFFAGKGFYIVLFLCAAVIGVSAWVMADGNETMDVNMAEPRVETIIIPAQQEIEEETLPVQAPQVLDEGLAETEAPTENDSVQVWREGDVMEVAAPVYAWPVAEPASTQVEPVFVVSFFAEIPQVSQV